MKIVNYGQEILETPTEKVTEFNEELYKVHGRYDFHDEGK